MERFVRKHIVWYKTLILVVNGVLFEKKKHKKNLTVAKIGD